jgi:hypothetical protein
MVIIFKATVGFEIVSTSCEAKARKNPSQFQFWLPRRPREQRKALCLVDQMRRIAQPEGASVAQDGQRIHNQCASRSLETVPTRRHARSHQCKAQLCRINRAQQQYTTARRVSHWFTERMAHRCDGVECPVEISKTCCPKIGLVKLDSIESR